MSQTFDHQYLRGVVFIRVAASALPLTPKCPIQFTVEVCHSLFRLVVSCRMLLMAEARVGERTRSLLPGDARIPA